MQRMCRGLLGVTLAALVLMTGPLGCTQKDDPPKDMPIPNVPPTTRDQGGKRLLTPDLKAPNKDATPKAVPEKK